MGVTSLEEEVFEGEEKEVLKQEQIALDEHIARKESEKKPVKKKGGKIKLPAHLPRRKIIHDLPENQKEGRPLIGEETTEELNIKVEFEVIQHIYPIYGQKKDSTDDEKAVISAKSPERILKGCQVSENFLAHTMVSKYSDGLPFYRQQQIYNNRYKLNIPRSRMCYWTINLGLKLEELTELMKQDIREGPLIQSGRKHSFAARPCVLNG